MRESMSLLEMSVSGGVLIIAIVAIRRLTVHSLPKKTFLCMWGVALCRLLIPFSFSSPLSVFSLVYTEGQGYGLLQGPEETDGLAQQALYLGREEITETLRELQVKAASEVAFGFSWQALLWAAGVLFCSFLFLAGYWNCQRRFKVSTPVKNEFVDRWIRGQSGRRGVQVRQSDRFTTPLCYGILRPVILLPSNMDWADEKLMRYIFLHEMVHIRRFDGVLKWILAACACMHWFNPFVWIMYWLANRDLELSCDETVIRTLGERAKANYALMLIRMEERKSGLLPLCSNFSRNATEERIQAIMKMRKTTALALGLAVALVVGLTAVFAASPGESSSQVNPNEPPAKSREISFVLPLEEMVVSASFDQNHCGVDLAAENDSDVFSAADGVVVEAEYDPSYGNFLVIQHTDSQKTMYAHCNELQEGEQKVDPLEKIGG